MPTIAIGGRRFGKTFAAAQAAGMPIDAYRELMRQQHERLASARALLPPAPVATFQTLWDEAQRPDPWWRIMIDSTPHAGHRAFMREYLGEFEPPSPEPMGPPAPTFEVWQRNQERNARDQSSRLGKLSQRGFRWEFTRPEWD